MVLLVQNRVELDKYLDEAGEKLVVIDFFANWCGPCKIIAPKLEELAEIYNEKCIVLKIDVDECEEIAVDYNITSMPTFLFIKNRQVVDTFIGGDPEKLVRNMEKYVGEPIVVEAEKAADEEKAEAAVANENLEIVETAIPTLAAASAMANATEIVEQAGIEVQEKPTAVDEQNNEQTI